MPVTNMILNGIELPGLVISDDMSPFGVLATTAPTLAGGMVIWEQRQTAGRQINLVGGADFGWLARSVLKSLKAMAAIPGASYSLQTSVGNYTVRFRNEEPPAIAASPIVERPNPEDADWYNNVQIKLMEV
jgi:hypothetical protein